MGGRRGLVTVEGGGWSECLVGLERWGSGWRWVRVGTLIRVGREGDKLQLLPSCFQIDSFPVTGGGRTVVSRAVKGLKPVP